MDNDRHLLLELLARYRGLVERPRHPAARFLSELAAAIGPDMQRPYRADHTITQFYSYPRHPALDIGMPVHTPIYAAIAGKVVQAGLETNPAYAGYAWRIKITDPVSGWGTLYAHLNYAAGVGVRVGQEVSKGELIGHSGNTGNSTGPHLHFELLAGPGFRSYSPDARDPRPHMKPWGPPPTTTPAYPHPYRVTKKRLSVYEEPRRTARVVDHYGVGELVTVMRQVPTGNSRETWLATPDGYCLAQIGPKTYMVRQ